MNMTHVGEYLFKLVNPNVSVVVNVKCVVLHS